MKESLAPQPRLAESPPGHATHHYHFRIDALDTALPLKAELDKTELLQAIHGHVLAQGPLIGTYGR